MKIYYLKHHYINTIRWDECIKNAVNGIIYAFSWYLDIVCEDWEALVADDYEIVMPLVHNKKYGISYLYQPVFTQQLGVFSRRKLSPPIVERFLQSIPLRYRFIELSLNTFNKISDSASEFKFNERVTYQLDLISTSQKIASHYSQNTIRNIKKAVTHKISVIKGLMPNLVVDFYKTHVGDPVFQYKEEQYDILRQIISFTQRYRFGEAYSAYTAQNNLCAMAYFIYSHNKAIFLLSVSSPEGKEQSAMFLLIDKFIEKNAEKNLVLDFEGSNEPGIARFYAGFGATPAIYYGVKQNRLPWYIRFLKK